MYVHILGELFLIESRLHQRFFWEGSTLTTTPTTYIYIINIDNLNINVKSWHLNDKIDIQMTRLTFKCQICNYNDK